MEYVLKFLNGDITFGQFYYDILNNDDVKNELRMLLPKETHDPKHQLWKTISIDYYKKYNFDMVKVLLGWNAFDGSIGDCLNIWGTVLRLYKYICPDFDPLIDYHKLYDLYLDTVGETYEGPEVEKYISDIIRECDTLKTKTAKRKAAKEKIREAFKLENGKKPYWIQGAEWPMGKNRPMTFRYQKKKGDQVEYVFLDEDTDNVRVVVQYY